MSDALNIDVSSALTSADAEMTAMTPLTTLASGLSREQPHLQLSPMAGKFTPLSFAPLNQELSALQHGCGIYDLGWLTHIAVRGEDRLRWLSGMVTNAVQQLPDGAGNYSFLLNAQGRIQGDAFVYRESEQLILAIDAEQVQRLLEHLDRFIIMDDVTLENLGEDIESMGLAGPQASELLTTLGLVIPESPNQGSAAIASVSWGGVEFTIVNMKIGETPRYEIWSKPANLLSVWKQTVAAGAQPCGLEAVETLRVLEGIPRYGIDLTDRDLPQETSQARALNFNKGCYLGQEIVERIRSRGAVHRSLRQFELTGSLPSLPADLMAVNNSIGKLTSAVKVTKEGVEAIYAMGIVRTDALTRGEALTYNEGTAKPLDHAPSF